MRILGIDPGIGRLGWGVVDTERLTVAARDYGCFETKGKQDDSVRLNLVFNFLSKTIDRYKPHVVAVEKLFFGANVTTAFSVGQARGVVLLSASQNNLSVFEYTPQQVKMAVTGYGRAEKDQIGKMVKLLLKLDSVPKPDDTADALAIAITHAFTSTHK